MTHRLNALFRPRSVAVIGATEREGTVGRTVIENLLRGGFTGQVFAVNPGRSSVCGVPCFASLADLPTRIEHAIFAVSDARIEAALDAAIAHGIRSATLFSSLVLEDDGTPALRERIQARLATAGVIACGANGMGFYNFLDGLWACGFQTRAHRRGGKVAYISHSGSGMCGIVDSDERIDFNFVVSTGQELAVRMDEYLDFVLEEPSTRVVGLFMETARDPPALARALEKASDRGIPVVALKVGRTELAARLTVSHSGAIAGVDGVYDALFEKYNVHRVDDMHELATTLIMFSQPHTLGAGGMVSIHDSGGERQLCIDLAHQAQVPLTTLTPETTQKLQQLLDPGLPAINPLDAWSTGGPDYHVGMQRCFATLMSDPGAAFGAVIHDRIAGGGIHAPYIDYLRAGHELTGKPAFLVANAQGTGTDPLVVEATRAGFPVLDGMKPFLRGARALLEHRDRQQQSSSARTNPAITTLPGIIPTWRALLTEGGKLDEHDSLSLLRDFQLPANPGRVVENAADALAAARTLKFPVVLKTATRGIDHKSDHDGVRLNLNDANALNAAYADIAQRLGPRALIAPMIRARGIEMLLGMVNDEQFGPVVLIGAGGVHVEALADVLHALPPFDAATARRLVQRLAIYPLLTSRRHRQPLAIDAFCAAAAKFSALVAALGPEIAEIDLNPVIVHAEGCDIVDALVVGRGPALLTRRQAS